jgi:hypothetical protein
MRNHIGTVCAACIISFICIPTALLNAQEPAALGPEEQAQVRELVKQLGDSDWETREKATEKLREFGERAAPQLTEAASSTDPEVANRANRILLELGYEPDQEKHAKMEGFLNDLRGKDKQKRHDAVLGLFELGGAALVRLKKLLSLPNGTCEATDATEPLGIEGAETGKGRFVVRNTDKTPFWVSAGFGADPSVGFKKGLGNSLERLSKSHFGMDLEGRAGGGYSSMTSGDGRNREKTDAERVANALMWVELLAPDEVMETPFYVKLVRESAPGVKLGEYSTRYTLEGRCHLPIDFLPDEWKAVLNPLSSLKVESKAYLLPADDDCGKLQWGASDIVETMAMAQFPEGTESGPAKLSLAFAASAAEFTKEEKIGLTLTVKNPTSNPFALWPMVPAEKSRAWYAVRNSEGVVVATGGFDDPVYVLKDKLDLAFKCKDKDGDEEKDIAVSVPLIPAGERVEEKVAIDTSKLAPGEYRVYAGFKWDSQLDICAKSVIITIRPQAGK